MKSSKVIHHPGRDGEQFSTVEDEIEDLRDFQASLTATYVRNLITADQAPDLTDSGNRWGAVTFVRSDGVMEIGRYLDFHNSDGDTSDYAVRLDTGNTTTDLFINGSKRILHTSDTRSEALSGIIEFPDNKDYRIVVNSPYGGTINSVTTRSSSGTCTLTVKINTTALGGSANSVSTSEQTRTHSTSNTFSAGDDIVLTVSANSNCEMLSVTIKYTRTLA